MKYVEKAQPSQELYLYAAINYANHVGDPLIQLGHIQTCKVAFFLPTSSHSLPDLYTKINGAHARVPQK